MVLGGRKGAYRLAASTRSKASSTSTSTWREGAKDSAVAAGRSAEKSAKALTKSGWAAPCEDTSTRTASPERGSAQTSTWSMVVRVDVGS